MCPLYKERKTVWNNQRVEEGIYARALWMHGKRCGRKRERILYKFVLYKNKNKKRGRFKRTMNALYKNKKKNN